MNVDQQDRENSSQENNQLLEHRKIEDSPFTAVRLEDKWFLTLGKYRLTEPMKSFEEVEDNSKNADWIRIMQIMNIMISERIEELQKHLKQN